MAYRLRDHQARIDRLDALILSSLSPVFETAAELSARLGADYSFVCAALKQIRSRGSGEVTWIVVPSVGRGRPKLAYRSNQGD